MLPEDSQVQLVRPPVPIRRATRMGMRGVLGVLSTFAVRDGAPAAVSTSVLGHEFLHLLLKPNDSY
jgi:hypothetical protein